MTDAKDWLVLIGALVMVILTIIYGIDCIRYANRTIRKAKETSESLWRKENG